MAFETGTSYFRFIGLFFSILGFKAITDGILRAQGHQSIHARQSDQLGNPRRGGAALLACVGIQLIWYAVPMGWTANSSDFVLLVPDRELEEAEAGVENISKSFIYRRLI